MIKVRQDLTGEVFGRLTVVQQIEDYISPNGDRQARWLCKCNCEAHTLTMVTGSNLKRKNGVRSCGCIGREKSSERMKVMAAVLNENKHKTNTYDLNGEYGVGWTFNTDNEFYFDLEDYEQIKDYCWFEDIAKDGLHRLKTNIPKTGKNISMHVLLGYKNHDHIDRNELNNRKSNLRPCTPTENNYNRKIFSNNTSGYTGVSFNKRLQKWCARLYKNNKLVLDELFDSKEDAVRARLLAEEKYCNGFASSVDKD